MKETFKSYQIPTEEEFKELWKDCIFVFDANVLLNIYSYTKNLREKFYKILETANNRVWLPHQVGLEFYENRNKRIMEAKESYDATLKSFKDTVNKLKSTLNDEKRNSLLPMDEYIKQIDAFYTKITDDIKAEKDKHEHISDRKDIIKEKLEQIFQGKTGEPYNKIELVSIIKEGKERYDKKPPIPPGYKDKDKKDDTQYGDLIIWKQMIKYAKEKESNIIFITDDEKEDWWWGKNQNSIKRPCPALLEEMRLEANIFYWQYSSSRFIDYAKSYFSDKVTITETEVQEAKEVGELANKYNPESFVNHNSVFIPTYSTPQPSGCFNIPSSIGPIISPLPYQFNADSSLSSYPPKYQIYTWLPSNAQIHLEDDITMDDQNEEVNTPELDEE